jgi:SprT protein
MDSLSLEQQVRERTLELIETARQRYQVAIRDPELRFDLKGKAAGMVVFRPGRNPLVRYNQKILSDNTKAFIQQTIPHEVAHLIARRRYGKGIKPHGPEWQGIMQDFGAEPKRCHNFTVSNIRSRRMRYFPYRCDCRAHQLSTIRHNRSQRGIVYLCRACGSPLLPIS